MNLSDRVTSYLRTVVPVLWGSLIGLLLPHLGWLPPEAVEWLSGEAAIGAVTALAIAAWYVAWRWAEPRVPEWLVRIALGSAAAPSYSPVYTPVPVDGPVLTSEERTNLGSLAAALDPGDPGRDALERVLQQ